uniref:Uncharacterized protein n=1 Tax=Oryza glumipatula TaxID=40148 RepID=A0A0E0ACG7_9ORYZ
MDLSPSSFPFVLSSRFSLLSSATQRRPPSPPIPLLDHPPTAPLSLLLSPSSPPPPSPPATDPIPPSSLEMDWPSPLGSSRHRRIELPRWSSSVPSRLGRSRPLGGGSGRRRGGRLSRGCRIQWDMVQWMNLEVELYKQSCSVVRIGGFKLSDKGIGVGDK